MKIKRKQLNNTVLTMTQYSDPNDGIQMTEWEFREYVMAWTQKSLMLKEQKEQNEQGSTASQDEDNSRTNLES